MAVSQPPAPRIHESRQNMNRETDSRGQRVYLRAKWDDLYSCALARACDCVLVRVCGRAFVCVSDRVSDSVGVGPCICLRASVCESVAGVRVSATDLR